jgi:hypothetical protein
MSLLVFFRTKMSRSSFRSEARGLFSRAYLVVDGEDVPVLAKWDIRRVLRRSHEAGGEEAGGRPRVFGNMPEPITGHWASG